MYVKLFISDLVIILNVALCVQYLRNQNVFKGILVVYVVSNMN